MELPASLRAALETVLEGHAVAGIAAAGSRLSARYRAEVLDGRLHLDTDEAARAYVATRLPATYAAIRRAMDLFQETLDPQTPAPETLLDVGAGPGTALWAAADAWPGLGAATMVEASGPIRRMGERLAEASGVAQRRWLDGRAGDLVEKTEPADLVTLAYVLDELREAERDQLVDALWRKARRMLLIVEPGTPAGWRRILAARSRLLALGANLVAPCPHSKTCPLLGQDWCHFAVRLARSRVHRLAKGADAPFEDEKFIFLAAAREPAHISAARILAPPQPGSGKVRLKLCRPDGRADDVLMTRRDGDAFKAARRAMWGDALYV
ncbi:small ribosomal subunit Rsm22 family protein [Aureimonas altamirensis]|uniref:small ribosomal subunit Rsm22 family protein n=1 Tax=Aureimonas altamirensis TaxID=370622 RepID=UPI002552B573|nr:small ribosomal subunit Rsm22 family protein [Aureimonas altamirensis]